MPLPERLILPVNVSRGTLQFPVPDELEGVTNGTLANIIRQLSNLSRHAEEMFGNLFREAEDVATRSSGLQARIDRLAVQVTQLDSTVEEVSLQDIHLRKAFRSSQTFDQQVVSRDTMPKAMLEVYLSCDRAPPLEKLNPYREDGKDGLKFYTDPNYFFELWRQDMLKDTERMMHDRGKKQSHSHVGEKTENEPGKSHNTSVHIGNGGSGQKAERNKKRVRQPHNTAEKQRQKAVGQGEYINQNDYDQQQQYQQELMNHHAETRSSGIVGYDPALVSTPNELRGQSQQQLRPNSIDVKRTYQGYQYNSNQEPIYTPRILRTEQPSSPQHHHQLLQQQQQQAGMYQYQSQEMYNQPDSAMQLTDAYGGSALYQTDQQQANSGNGTPTRRPNQPPPAPPPGGETPTRHSRGVSSQRDSLPPPPPPPANELQQGLNPGEFSNRMTNSQQQSPMQQLMSQLNSHHHQNPVSSLLHNNLRGSSDVDLPPPPPVPTNTGLLSARVPPEHFPPSPPPPPDPSSNGLVDHMMSPHRIKISPEGVAGPPPPPPPPPPMMPGEIINGFRNGDLHQHKDNSFSPVKTNGSPPKSILSPQGMRKPVPPKHLSVQDGIRSDLLKAIRDGIALRKVEETQQAKEEEKAGGGQSDVASILARRVAVEMSDSDEAGGGAAPSDSEYDSDDWGDESTA